MKKNKIFLKQLFLFNIIIMFIILYLVIETRHVWKEPAKKDLAGYNTAEEPREEENNQERSNYYSYEKTKNITILSDKELKAEEIVNITIPPIIVMSSDERITQKNINKILEEVEMSEYIDEAYVNEDKSISLILYGEQFNNQIELMEQIINDRIHSLENDGIDVFISNDFINIKYYIYDNCEYTDFLIARALIEPQMIYSQVFSGIEYKDCKINSYIINKESGEELFSYNCDSERINGIPEENEWNEKLGIIDGVSSD